MSAIQLGTAGLSFGLIAETGLIVENVEIRDAREKAEVLDPDGDVVAVAYFKPTTEVQVSGVQSGGTGIGAASPGVALTVANYVPSAGIIITEEVTITKPNTDYKRLDVKAIVYPLVTS